MAKRKSGKAAPPQLPPMLHSLLTALQGAPYTGAIAPQVLRSGLASIRSHHGWKKPVVAVPATADVWSGCWPKPENSGCQKKARIVATYYNVLGAGDKPIGEAAVTAILNLAASQRCADELQCPRTCPAWFTKQKKLFEYSFFAGVGGKGAAESGILTIPTPERNCRCEEEDTDVES